jgi:hypothetical protein
LEHESIDLQIRLIFYDAQLRETICLICKGSINCTPNRFRNSAKFGGFVETQEAKYVEGWPNTTSALGWLEQI